MLPKTYRFQIMNETGQTLADGAVTIKAVRYKFTSGGAVSYEGSEGTAFSTAGTTADDAYLNGTTQDNSANLYVGGHFELTVTAPASAAGNVTCFLQRSMDGGTTFDGDGLGEIVAAINFTTSGTKVKTFEV